MMSDDIKPSLGRVQSQHGELKNTHMVEESLVRPASLASQIESRIKKRIIEGIYARGSQLPPENQIAEELEVSRTTVRSAYDALAGQGLIVRKHGIGTFVAKLPSLANPYETLSMDMYEIISAHGYRPGFKQLRAEVRQSDHGFSSLMEVPLGSDYLEVHKLFTADDQPIILYINRYPAWLFTDAFSMEDATPPGMTEPPEGFLAKHLGIKLVRFNSTIRPDIAANLNLQKVFLLEDPCTPLLIVEDIGFDTEGRKVFYSLEHLAGDAARYEINRSIGQAVRMEDTQRGP
jgi:GntR family transcriptional regulator